MQTSAIKPQEQIRNTTNNNAIDVKNIVSQSERHYFENLFPDSSSLLQNHILFNRSGKITEMNVNKGSLLDAKA